MGRLGIIEEYEHASDYLTATIRLQPYEGLVLASDRHFRIDGPVMKERHDTVYDPVDHSGYQYIKFLPRRTSERCLELCAGTGVGALIAAKNFANHAWASDINERCTRFTAFNMNLNDIRNVTPLTGNLFEPLQDRKFDYIIAHPPYLPSVGKTVLYSAGGQVGDELTLELVRRLPQHLCEGGIFYGHAVVLDRQSRSFEENLRDRLGTCSADFDIFTMVRGDTSPAQFCSSMRAEKKYSTAEALLQMSVFEDNKVIRLNDCSFLLHRIQGRRRTFTVRRSYFDPACMNNLFQREIESATQQEVNHKTAAEQLW